MKKRLLIAALLLGVIFSLLAACEHTPTPVMIEVSFEKYGGEGEADPISVKYNEPYGELPAGLTKEGYTFGGWWSEENGTGNEITSTTKIIKDRTHTLYAKWAANTYTTTLDAKGGYLNDGENKVPTAEKQVQYGAYYTLPVPYYSGHVFYGWRSEPYGEGIVYTDPQGESIKEWFDLSHMTLYACWDNEGAPSLSVPSLSSYININTLYTLPVATALGKPGAQIFIDVSVIAPDMKPVKEYGSNEYGYATGMPGKEIKFDNENVLSFYATQLGEYKITYKASDDLGRESAPYMFIVECADKLSPIIARFDTEIPSKWSFAEAEDGANSFVLPLPACTDNYTKEDDLVLTISIVNPNSRTVARWEAKISNFKAGNAPLLDAYKMFLKPSENLMYSRGLLFSFDYFDFENSEILKDKDTEKIGEWTITYVLRDEFSNGGSGAARKSFAVEVS